MIIWHIKFIIKHYELQYVLLWSINILRKQNKYCACFIFEYQITNRCLANEYLPDVAYVSLRGTVSSYIMLKVEAKCIPSSSCTSISEIEISAMPELPPWYADDMIYISTCLLKVIYSCVNEEEILKKLAVILNKHIIFKYKYLNIYAYIWFLQTNINFKMFYVASTVLNELIAIYFVFCLYL